MRKKDKFDYQAEELLEELIKLEQEDFQKAANRLSEALRDADKDGWDQSIEAHR